MLIEITQFGREVNNRFTGWAFAHLVKFAHQVNSTCPLPKITHPVNYLAHRKMGTNFIKNRQFRPKLFFYQNWPTTKGKLHSSTPRIGVDRQYLIVLSWNLSIILVCWTISTHLNTPVQEILHCVFADDGIERVMYRVSQSLWGNTVETLRFLCLNERNISLVAICAVI